MVPLEYFLILSAVLFIIGVTGVLTRRNALIILMSIELMLNAANLAFLAFSGSMNSMHGQAFVFFVITIAAAEVAIGLAIVILIFKSRATTNVDELNLMKW